MAVYQSKEAQRPPLKMLVADKRDHGSGLGQNTGITCMPSNGFDRQRCRIENFQAARYDNRNTKNVNFIFRGYI